MKLQLLILLGATPATIADYVCPVRPSMTDAKAIAFGYTVQELLRSYYESVPTNASFFSGLPMAGTMASNGQTLAENTVSNVNGLAKQASLGATALMEVGGMLGLSPSPCKYTFPPAPNGTAHLMNAYYFEATMCGAFIGLADYFQSAELNSLSARLAAEHGIHASAIRAMMQPVGFMANSTMLTPAFTPDMILETGMEVGKLGDYIGKCVSAPTAPCGGTVSFGDLLPTLTMGGNGYTNTTPSGSVPALTQMPSTNRTAPAVYTGAGTSLQSRYLVDLGAIMALVAAMVSI